MLRRLHFLSIANWIIYHIVPTDCPARQWSKFLGKRAEAFWMQRSGHGRVETLYKVRDLRQRSFKRRIQTGQKRWRVLWQLGWQVRLALWKQVQGRTARINVLHWYYCNTFDHTSTCWQIWPKAHLHHFEHCFDHWPVGINIVEQYLRSVLLCIPDWCHFFRQGRCWIKLHAWVQST